MNKKKSIVRQSELSRMNIVSWRELGMRNVVSKMRDNVLKTRNVVRRRELGVMNVMGKMRKGVRMRELGRICSSSNSCKC